MGDSNRAQDLRARQRELAAQQATREAAARENRRIADEAQQEIDRIRKQS